MTTTNRGMVARSGFGGRGSWIPVGAIAVGVLAGVAAMAAADYSAPFVSAVAAVFGLPAALAAAGCALLARRVGFGGRGNWIAVGVIAVGVIVGVLVGVAAMAAADYSAPFVSAVAVVFGLPAALVAAGCALLAGRVGFGRRIGRAWESWVRPAQSSLGSLGREVQGGVTPPMNRVEKRNTMMSKTTERIVCAACGMHLGTFAGYTLGWMIVSTRIVANETDGMISPFAAVISPFAPDTIMVAVLGGIVGCILGAVSGGRPSRPDEGNERVDA